MTHMCNIDTHASTPKQPWWPNSTLDRSAARGAIQNAIDDEMAHKMANAIDVQDGVEDGQIHLLRVCVCWRLNNASLLEATCAGRTWL